MELCDPRKSVEQLVEEFYQELIKIPANDRTIVLHELNKQFAMIETNWIYKYNPR